MEQKLLEHTAFQIIKRLVLNDIFLVKNKVEINSNPS